MPERVRKIAIALIILGSIARAGAEPLSVVGFNLQSGESRIATLAAQVAAIDDVDIWGFSEAESAWAYQLRDAAADGESARYWFIRGTTGDTDRLMIVFDKDRLEEVRHYELHHVNIQRKVRAPLVAHLRLRSTSQEFLFLVNHLYRGSANGRHTQARLLNEWAAKQTLPIIAVGDYNFDWDLSRGDTSHDRGFDLMTANDTFVWVRPSNRIVTHCHPKFRSILDFIFVAGAAKQWPATSTILFPQASYCPDTAATSDHRPVRATFELAAAPPPTAAIEAAKPPTLEQLLERIERIESHLGIGSKD